MTTLGAVATGHSPAESAGSEEGLRGEDRRQAGRATSFLVAAERASRAGSRTRQLLLRSRTLCLVDRRSDGRGDVLEPGPRLGSGYHGSCKVARKGLQPAPLVAVGPDVTRL